MHKMAVHEGVMNHICKVCGYAALYNYQLKSHQKTVHDKIRDIPCETCPFKAPTKSHLAKHIKSAHEKAIHKCQFCSHTSTTKNQIELHVKAVHFGTFDERIFWHCNDHISTSYLNACSYSRNIDGSIKSANWWECVWWNEATIWFGWK